MRQNWIDEDTCNLAGVNIVVGKTDYDNMKTTADQVFILKGESFFKQYSALTADKPPRKVLELGIFEGGSAMLFADMWEKAAIVGIDLRSQNDEVAKHLERLGFSERVKLFYGVSQDDQNRVAHIIENELESKVDLVIDDASHLYGLTKSTFEIVFPYLANGGLYIIEDWGWAHWKEWQTPNHYSDQPAMSNLVFELVMASASNLNIIAKVMANKDLCIIEKAEYCPPLNSNFKLDDIYFSRGKKLNLI